MTELFRFADKATLASEVVDSAKEQWENLKSADSDAILALAKKCIDEIEHLHNVADIILDPPEDIDAIWSISAPGWLTKEGSVPGWCANFPQLDGCEKEVMGKTIDLATAVTAKRLHKKPQEVTREDILKHGPWIIYNGPPEESQDLATYLTMPDVKIAREKVYIFDKKKNGQDIFNTIDQADSIDMPPAVTVRKVAISVLAAQWVRLGRLLASTKTLPDVPVVLVPTSSPKGFEKEHAVMESRGAVINVFQHHITGVEEIQYST